VEQISHLSSPVPVLLLKIRPKESHCSIMCITNTSPLIRINKKDMTKLTAENFDAEVLQATEPVLVDFSAVWCGPCKMLEPVLEELSNEVEGAKIVKVDVDETPDIAQRYSVMSMPTLLFFKDGKVMDQMVGVQSKGTIQSKLEELKA
jgi:thioredoxin 1